jgi:N-acetylneuraminic acid mutarotase
MRLLRPDFILLFSFIIMAQILYAQTHFTVKNLPKIPDNDGFAGSLAGVSNGALIVAGGSNFPNGGRPWNGSTKKWYDHVLVLEKPNGKWLKAGKLPRLLGYSVSLTWRDAVVCIGGSNEEGHFAESFLMRWENRQVTFENLPDFPSTIANASGAIVGDILYVAGGLEKPNAKEALHTFYTLDLSAEPIKQSWKLLPSWSGEARMLSVSASYNGKFYLCSGTNLIQSTKDKSVQRAYLNDAYSYDPKTNQWVQLANLPHSSAAAPNPVFVFDNQIILVGGDSGENAANTLVLKDKHPGFNTKIIGYDIHTDQWKTIENFLTDIKVNAETHPNESTYLPVTTPLVAWHGGYVMPGGEVRPGTRTPRVLMIKPNRK